MGSEKLKPCPFCGWSPPILVELRDAQKQVQCLGCGASAGVAVFDEGGAERAWNRRTPPREAPSAPQQTTGEARVVGPCRMCIDGVQGDFCFGCGRDNTGRTPVPQTGAPPAPGGEETP